MIFASPLWLFGLFVLVPFALIESWMARRDHQRVARLVARPLWSKVVRRSASHWRWIRLGLLLLGAAGLVVALARPEWGIVREKVEREGVDVVLVLDSSGSMATEDVPPNRFFVAAQALTTLIGRLEGDRFALVAFEGDAYALCPLTLDADALGLFLETMEPGIIASPGSSLGAGIAKGLDLFIDKDRRNKVMVLVSDGEDLEGEVEVAVKRAKEAGVVIHTVGVGTEGGQPVPDFDREGRRVGFKRDDTGEVVVSRLDMRSLEPIARGSGGRAFRITPSDPNLAALTIAIEGMERKSLAREFSYRRKERFQIPLAVGVVAIALALLLPLPLPRRWVERAKTAASRPAPRVRRASGAATAAATAATTTAALALALVLPARAQAPSPATPGPATQAPAGSTTPETVRGPRRGADLLDELLLRPKRLTQNGKKLYREGNHPQALSDFERAARSRPKDPRAHFNVADGLFKNGKYGEAATLFKSLGGDTTSPLAAGSRFNLGNALYEQKDYRGAIQSYRDALRLAPDDLDARRNLELALRALQEQQEQQQKQQQQNQDKNQDKNQDQNQKQDQQQGDQSKQNQNQGDQQKTAEQREDERFRQQVGMPKDRAMALLQALEQNEKAEQKKLLLQKRARKKGGKDW